MAAARVKQRDRSQIDLGSPIVTKIRLTAAALDMSVADYAKSRLLAAMVADKPAMLAAMAAAAKQ